MILAAVVFFFLAAVLAIGLVVKRASAPHQDAEDFFLAGGSLGPAVFLLSLFGANMTAFSILGASGHAFANGIVTYGSDGVFIRAHHPRQPVRDRYAPVGAWEAPRLHDTGPDVSRPLGVRPHRHRHLRSPGRSARALYRDCRHRRRRDALQVRTGRLFVILVTLLAYAVALVVPQSIFDIATQYAFAGYSALSPLLVAALFWKGSTRWGALAATLWTAAAVLAVAVLQTVVPPPPPGAAVSILSVGGVDVIARAAAGTTVLGLLPVVPMTLGSALVLVVVSRCTPASRPGHATLARYFR